MADEQKPKTLEELKKKVGNPNLVVSPIMILKYGEIELYLESNGFDWDGFGFCQSLKVVKEIIPEGMVVTFRKKRAPKTTEAKPQAAKAGAKK
jgi:hypothetical protein